MRVKGCFLVSVLLVTVMGAGYYLGVNYHHKIKRFTKHKIYPVLGIKPKVRSLNPKPGLNIAEYQTYLKSLQPKFKAKAYIPKMVRIPGGTFLMGCERKECEAHEAPEHEVRIEEFEMAATEITFDQWDICVAMGGCKYLPDDQGWGRGQMPLINVSWQQMVNEFIPWLNANSAGGFRLPSEAEWEYAARDGKQGKLRPWGDENPGCDVNSPKGARFGARYPSRDLHCDIVKPAPVGSYAPTSWGLYDMTGNVLEFTQDCYNFDKSRKMGPGVQKVKAGYYGAPKDGSSWEDSHCSQRMIRGGSWNSLASIVRVSLRRAYSKKFGYDRVGFRLARDKNLQ